MCYIYAMMQYYAFSRQREEKDKTMIHFHRFRTFHVSLLCVQSFLFLNYFKMIRKIIILLLLSTTAISKNIDIPPWDFEMNEYEMKVGGRLIWISVPENRDAMLTPVYLSLVIDPYYPKAERNGSVCKSFGPFDIPEKTFNASTCFDSNSSSTKCGFWKG